MEQAQDNALVHVWVEALQAVMTVAEVLEE